MCINCPKQQQSLLNNTIGPAYRWVGIRGVSKVVPRSTMWCGCVLQPFYGHYWGVWIIPSFRILGYDPCWAHFMCHLEVWPKSVGHPLSILNSSSGLRGGKHYQKITILIFRIFPKNLLPRLPFLYSFLFRSCILTFFKLVCYCSIWLYFRHRTS